MATAADSDGFVPDDDGFVPDAPPVAKTPAAPFVPEKPPTFGESLSAGVGALLQPFKDIGHSVLETSGAVGNAVAHPVDTFGGGRALPFAREAMRSVNSNIPFANDAVEAIGGPPAVSPQDQAAAPGGHGFGALLGLPVAGMVGGIGAKAVEVGAPLLGRALSSASAGERQVTRAVEDLGERVTKKATRAGVKTEPVEALVRENPELRAAAGDDAKTAQVVDQAKTKAQGDLRRIYSAAPSEVSPSNAIANMDTRIAELSKGTSNEREVARALKSVRDEFHAAHGEKTGITPFEMRAEQSAYQKKGYGKAMPGDEAATARIAANQEASKAVGEAVVRHVTGMGYTEAKAAAEADPAGIAAQLFKANKTINATNKIEAAIGERAARVQPKVGLGGRLEHLSHTVHNLGLAVAGKALQVGPRAVDAVLASRGMSPATEETLRRFVGAAQGGNPFAQRQVAALAATPAGAARIAAVKAIPQQQGATP